MAIQRRITKKGMKTSDKVAAGKEAITEDRGKLVKNEIMDGEGTVLAKIAELPDPYRAMGERLHVIIMASGPSLSPRLWYGMPAYAKEGKVVCFFRGGDKFKERYMTLGFNDVANLDEGVMWPIAYALKDLTPAEEEYIASLVKKAVS
jgi:hypothetical protein